MTYGRASGPLDVADVRGVKEFYRNENGKLGSPFYAKDRLGREYYMPVEVEVGNEPIPGENRTYAQKLGAKNADGSVTGRWQLPYPVISAEALATVVDTELTERAGVVSELINLRGYRIRVRGFCIANGDFPEDDVQTLHRLYSLGQPFRINCALTDLLFDELSEDKLVTMRRLSWPELPGVQHVRPYELELITEIPFNLVDIS